METKPLSFAFNVSQAMVDGKLHLVIDLSKGGKLSSTGKSTLYASTRGNKSIQMPDGSKMTIGLNLYRKTA